MSDHYEDYKNAGNKGKIIHWVPVEENKAVEILLDTGSILKGYGEISLQNCKEGENLIKQTCTKCAYCKAIETKIKELKTDGTKCKNPCGTKCCKAGYKCITINQCKGKKKPCMLPLLRYCDKKAPDPLSGRLSTFECE